MAKRQLFENSRQGTSRVSCFRLLSSCATGACTSAELIRPRALLGVSAMRDTRLSLLRYVWCFLLGVHADLHFCFRDNGYRIGDSLSELQDRRSSVIIVMRIGLSELITLS